MPNPNNCQLCDHMHNRVHPRDDALYCYMFKDEPTDVCMCHTGLKGMTATETTGDVYSLTGQRLETQGSSQILRRWPGVN